MRIVVKVALFTGLLWVWLRALDERNEDIKELMKGGEESCE